MCVCVFCLFFNPNYRSRSRCYSYFSSLRMSIHCFRIIFREGLKVSSCIWRSISSFYHLINVTRHSLYSVQIRSIVSLLNLTMFKYTYWNVFVNSELTVTFYDIYVVSKFQNLCPILITKFSCTHYCSRKSETMYFNSFPLPFYRS